MTWRESHSFFVVNNQQQQPKISNITCAFSVVALRIASHSNSAAVMATDARLAELYERKIAKLREQKQLADTFNQLLTKHV